VGIAVGIAPFENLKTMKFFFLGIGMEEKELPREGLGRGWDFIIRPVGTPSLNILLK
jgi:hypothetical protein